MFNCFSKILSPLTRCTASSDTLLCPFDDTVCKGRFIILISGQCGRNILIRKDSEVPKELLDDEVDNMWKAPKK
jgi:hypothetical protein